MKKIIVFTYMLVSAFICIGQVTTLTNGNLPFVEFNERTLEFLWEPAHIQYEQGKEYSYSETLCENSVKYINNMISITFDDREMTMTYNSDDCRFISQIVLYNSQGYADYIIDYPKFKKFD